MRFKRSATILGTALVIGGFGTAAAAATTLSQSSFLPANGSTTNITVNFSGFNQADGSVFIQQCWKNGNTPGVVFDSQLDCNQSLTANPTILAGGSGSGRLDVFSGDEPNLGDWGCGPGTTTGLPRATTCYIRVVPGVLTNVAADEFTPITFDKTDPPVVPEVPLNILLPLSAMAVLGGGALIANRKRQTRNVAA